MYGLQNNILRAFRQPVAVYSHRVAKVDKAADAADADEHFGAQLRIGDRALRQQGGWRGHAVLQAPDLGAQEAAHFAQSRHVLHPLKGYLELKEGPG